jgi:hypothetical protein
VLPLESSSARGRDPKDVCPVTRVAQDRAGGQREADKRCDQEAHIARHRLEMRAESKEQSDETDRCSEHPEQVSASLLRHRKARIADHWPGRHYGSVTVRRGRWALRCL